jgi:signal transduction histidine kinase
VKLPLSLHSRIGLLSISMVVILFLLNMNAILDVAEGTVVNKIDDQLDGQVRMLARAVDRDGRFSIAGLASVPELVAPPRGWGWDVRTRTGHWGRGLAPGRMDYPVPHYHLHDGIYSGRGLARSGAAVHTRRYDVGLPVGGTTIVVMSPRGDIDTELARIRVEMDKIAAEILLVLIGASVLQIFIGLHPLRKLVKDVARVRAGDATLLPEQQPSDLMPLASEINALIARSDAGLATARVHAANLAHAVKTPLASLMLQLEYEGASREAQDLVAHLSERVAHHLHRARHAATRGGGKVYADAAIVARRVRSTLSLVHRGGGVTIGVSIVPPCLVAVEEEDLGEMIANLVENACRHAGRAVTVSASVAGSRVIIDVDDDGSGIPEHALAAVLQPGIRLDEAQPGYGLGLAIVSELAELYGGALTLGRCQLLGGLRATLDLPRR